MDTTDTLILLAVLDFKKLIFWIIIGIVAGLLARAILPGKQSMNIIATMGLGIAGALLGGYVAYKIPFIPQETTWAHLVTATIGAFVLLVIFELIKKMMKK